MPSLTPATHVAAFPSFARATRKAALFLVPLVMLLAGGAVVCAQSALDGFDPNANGTIRVVVVQPAGKILIGGDFTTLSPNGGAAVTRNHIARLNPDGTLDGAFDPNADVSVWAIAVQTDGRILVGGDFTSIGGQTRNHIARLDAATGLADSFDPNASAFVGSIMVQVDGKILVGGQFTSIGGQARNRIARLDAATGLADSFDPNVIGGEVDSIAVQADGRILVSGDFASIGGQARASIARLDAATGLADSFNPNANGQITSIAVQADGKILAGGSFTSMGGQPRNRIARLDPTTGLADLFDPNANETVVSIALQADGKIFAGGFFTSIGGQPRNRIARLDPTSGLADLFDPNANNIVWAIAVQADGKILAGGFFNGAPSIGGQARNHIARLEADGRLDQTLNLFTVGFLGGTTAVQPDGKILIAGVFTSVLGVPRSNMVRLNTDGTLDTAFNPGPTTGVNSIAVQADGKILASGNFTEIGGQTRDFIARLDAATGLADSFNPNANGPVYSVAVQADGKILVGGEFNHAKGTPTIGGQTRNYIARLDATTGLADSFDPDVTDVIADVNSVAVQADGKILVGGSFTHLGGQVRNRIARLDATSGLADSFNPNANGVIESIVVQADGKILAGGFFSSIGGQTRNNIARIDPTTGLADSFDPNANDIIYTVAVQADGKVLAGGRFTHIGGQTRNSIARLNATSGLADSFNPSASDVVFSIVVQADGKISAAGQFTSIGGQPRNYFARLTNDTAALQDLAVTPTTMTWTLGGSSPQMARVTFEYSDDNVSFIPLGNGTPAGSNWNLTGLSFPSGLNFYVRARGYYRSSYFSTSESITESVRNAFLTGPIGTPTPTPTGTPTQTPSPTPTPRPATLGNISTRLQVGTADRVMIAGFIVQGSAPKRVLIRAAGPSLAKVGVPNALANPQLALNDSKSNIGRNDDWQTTQVGGVITSDQVAEIQGSGLAPSDPAESAMIATLPPGSYTAIVQGAGDGTGVGIVEVYDLDATSGTLLANISTRGFVQTGDNAMIGGFIVVTQPTRVIVRAIGPSLQPGVADVLANPQLELHDASSLIAQNDDWQTTELGGIITSDQVAEIQKSQLAPINSAESAIVATLQPGSYTAVVRGVNKSTGNGLVEVYALQ